MLLDLSEFFVLCHFRPPGKLCFIDHIVGNQPDDAMVSIAEWWVLG